MSRKVNQIFGSDKDTETLTLSNLKSVVLSSFYFDKLDDLFTSLKVGSNEVKYKEVSTSVDGDTDVVVSISPSNTVEKVVIGQEEIIPSDIVEFWSDESSIIIETSTGVFKIVRASGNSFSRLSDELVSQSRGKVLVSSWEGM